MEIPSKEFMETVTWGYRMILGREPAEELVRWQDQMVQPRTTEEVRRRLFQELSGSEMQIDESRVLPDISTVLHQGRSSLLRQVPKGAEVFLSAGCAGLWFFEWVEQCYGRPNVHIGLEYYTPKPESLPSNVRWIENTCSDMAGVASRSCDLVFSGQNFEHLWPDELLGFLLETARVLKDGGLLVMDSPNRTVTEALKTWSHPEHTVEATTAEAERLVGLAGFDITARKGVWLGRDPQTKDVLDFDALESRGWSVAERLIVGASAPDDAFIWWLEAKRADRAPEREALSRAVYSMFESAWPERVGRTSSAVGTPISVNGQDWIEAEAGTAGALVFGPYMPLRAGKYACTFHLWAEGETQSGADAICDVFLLSLGGALVSREVVVSHNPTAVTIDFELHKLEFGVEFRCLGNGRRRLRCRRRVDLLTLPSGLPSV